MLAASLNLYSTPAGDVNLQPVEAQMAPALLQFKFVAAGLVRTTTSLDDIQDSSWSSGFEEAKQLNSYISSIGIGPYTSSRCTGLLVSAEASVSQASSSCDLLAASQAYVERISYVCGLLTAGRRNRTNTSLEMRACLKLNSHVLKETEFVFL